MNSKLGARETTDFTDCFLNLKNLIREICEICGSLILISDLNAGSFVIPLPVKVAKHVTGGVALLVTDDLHTTAIGLDDRTFGDLIERVVRTLRMDMRPEEL